MTTTIAEADAREVLISGELAGDGRLRFSRGIAPRTRIHGADVDGILHASFGTRPPRVSAEHGAITLRYRGFLDGFWSPDPTAEGIEKHPGDARMYRHRGHRYITVRELDNAIQDLEHAAELVRGTPDEVEPDGMPNPHGIPRSTLHSNIWYHLALAHYLKHDFGQALGAWHRALEVSDNDDMHVASADWLYMTYRRLGRDVEAARVLERIHADMEILENHAYHRRLLMYKGEIPADSLLNIQEIDDVQLATYGYGVANWHLYNGEPDRARELFERILEGPQWPAFGYLAAEAELTASR